MDAVSFEIRNSRNILLANYHSYRVTRTFHPAATAVKLFNSSDIRFRNVHVNAESGYPVCDANGCGTFLRLSKYPYENAIMDLTSHLNVREREFADSCASAAARSSALSRRLDVTYSTASAAKITAVTITYGSCERNARTALSVSTPNA